MQRKPVSVRLFKGPSHPPPPPASTRPFPRRRTLPQMGRALWVTRLPSYWPDSAVGRALDVVGGLVVSVGTDTVVVGVGMSGELATSPRRPAGLVRLHGASVWRSRAAVRSGSRRSRTRRRGPLRGARSVAHRTRPAPHAFHQLAAALAPLLPEVLEVLLGATGQFSELLLRTGHHDLLVDAGTRAGTLEPVARCRAPARAELRDGHLRLECPAGQGAMRLRASATTPR